MRGKEGKTKIEERHLQQRLSRRLSLPHGLSLKQSNRSASSRLMERRACCDWPGRRSDPWVLSVLR